MRYVIHHTFNMSLFGSYTSEARALRALTNAQQKGWKLDGRHVQQKTLNSLSVVSAEEYQQADTLVPVQSIMNPTGEPVMIRRSQVGGCCDPSTERHWSM